MNLTLRSRLLLSIVGVVLFVGVFSALFGIRAIRRSLPQVQDIVAVDLGAAQEIFRQNTARISEAVRLTARQPILRVPAEESDAEALAAFLNSMREADGLDILNLTDPQGNLLLRSANPTARGGARVLAAIARRAATERRELSSALALTGDELALEHPALAERAKIEIVSTSYSRPAIQGDPSAGMVVISAVPLYGPGGKLQGVLCGGQLLNRQTALPDRMRSILYRDEKYDGHDVAVISIFLGDKRIATSATNDFAERAVGTLASKEVFDRVSLKGQKFIDRGYVINDWYLTAYEPIKDLDGKVIGILGLGLLERKFSESVQRSSKNYLLLILVALLLAAAIACALLNSIMRPVKALMAATETVAVGASLQDVKLDRSPPEIQALVCAFNRMQGAIRERRRQNQDKLMRSDKLAMVGQLAAGVAHEINNPLGSILLFSRLVMQQVPPDGRVRENLERIEKETKRCHSIVQSLLDFSRQREPAVEPVDVNGLLDATLKLFERQFLFHNIEVIKDYSATIPRIPADPSQLQQVFMNIIINAADAMKGKGRLTLETGNGDEDGCVAISIADTGCGIPAENIGRIFDPFFTTKGVGHGTGLGLSVSYGIVQRHNGDISVASSPGAGTTFTITLPTTREGE